MKSIELDFEYLPGMAAEVPHLAAATGVAIELALQAVQLSGATPRLRTLVMGAPLVFDRALRCRALCDPGAGFVRVLSEAIESDPHSSVSPLLHLSAQLATHEEPSQQLAFGNDALGALRAVSHGLPRGPAVGARAEAVEVHSRSLVAALSLHAHGLEAELTQAPGDVGLYALHPLYMHAAAALVRAFVGTETQTCGELERADRFELFEPAAVVTRLRVVRDPLAGDRGLTLIALSKLGVAWFAGGVALAASGNAAPAAPARRFARGELAERLRSRPVAERRAECERALRMLIGELGGLAGDAIEPDRAFRDLGLASRATVELAAELSLALDREISPTLVLDHPTLSRLLLVLLEPNSTPNVPTGKPRPELRIAPHLDERAIAVIGIGCRFPASASSPDAFYELIASGADTVGQVPARRVALAPGMARHRLPASFLDDIDAFDAQFFGTSEREAAAMDPQQRLLLELTWEALERAGIVPASLIGSRTGVFVAVAPYGYAHLLGELDAFSAIGNEPSAAAGRLSYFFGLRGPSMCVDTACSSSLVAVCLACDALRRGEIDLAIVGGANLLLEPMVTEGLLAAGVLSRVTNRCRAFDADADGYVRGEGAGVVLLRRAADARGREEPIHALVRGYAVSHGGRANGLGVPSKDAQTDVIRLALERSEIDPREVGYCEAHGTGTALGDAIELQAIDETYGAVGRAQPLHVGSVKANIGHTELAAGIAGLIKAIMVVERGAIPPHPHFQRPSPAIDWTRSPLAITRHARLWPAAMSRRIAAVNALGMSGTYAHVLIEAAEPAAPMPQPMQARASAEPSPVPYLVAVHGRTPERVCTLARAYAEHLQRGGSPARLAATTQRHRQRLIERSAAVGSTVEQLRVGLLAIAEQASLRSAGELGHPKLAFLYSGLGGQHVGMGRQLAAHCPVFRGALEQCERALAGRLPCSLFDALDGGPDAARWLALAGVSQPAVFAIQYALTVLWRSWGVEPDVVMGHSLGEFAAAQVAGVLSLDDALLLTAERGRLMDTLARGGAMAAVDAPRELVEAHIAAFPGALWLAAVNAPDQLVVSGTLAAVDAVAAQLEAGGYRARRLAIPVAAHSELLAPILDAFERHAERVAYHAPERAIVSTMYGTRVDGEMSCARYFRDQLRSPVEFARGMHTLLHDERVNAFLEIGPHPVLIGPAAACADAPDKLFVAAMCRERDQLRQMLDAAAELYGRGIELDFAALPGERASHDPTVPTYAFERRSHWVRARTAAPAHGTLLALTPDEPALAPAAPIERWLRLPRSEAVAELEQLIKSELRRILDLQPGETAFDQTFGELGLSSLGAVQLRACMQRWIGSPLPLSLIKADRTAASLAAEAWGHAARAA